MQLRDCVSVSDRHANHFPASAALISSFSFFPFFFSLTFFLFAVFLFGREALRRMQPKGHGTILFTGASASMRGRANFGAFNSSKAALRNFAQAMAKECGPEGIHVGHVVVDGPIGGDKIIQGFPQYAEKLGDAGMISIEGIVDGFAYLYHQPARAWSFEIDVRTSLERW